MFAHYSLKDPVQETGLRQSHSLASRDLLCWCQYFKIAALKLVWLLSTCFSSLNDSCEFCWHLSVLIRPVWAAISLPQSSSWTLGRICWICPSILTEDHQINLSVYECSSQRACSCCLLMRSRGAPGWTTIYAHHGWRNSSLYLFKQGLETHLVILCPLLISVM